MSFDLDEGFGNFLNCTIEEKSPFETELAISPTIRAYRKAGYLTMVIAGYIPANSQLAAAIATIVKSLSIGK